MSLMVAGVHGMEWLTSALLFKFTFAMCNAIVNDSSICGVNIREALKKNGLVIIPCLNPDGVEISLYGPEKAGKYKNLVKEVSKNDTSNWQANARGVDLNHNFDADWDNLKSLEIKQGIIAPSPTRYGGTHPESEIETKALAQLCRGFNFRHAVAFHSQGEEIYWDYGKNTPKQSKQMAQKLALSSGYELSKPEGLAVGGGFKDWFIQALHKPAFTIEIGKGKNPLPLKDLTDIYDRLEEMLVLCCTM